MSVSAPASFKFSIGDRVVVVRKGADCKMTGVITGRIFGRSLAKLLYEVEFNRIDKQFYGEADLALAPEPQAA